jgi:hypothetical protein
MMRPCATDLPPFMPDRCPAGRDPVRAQRAESLPRHSALAGVQPCKNAATERPGPGDGQPGAGWHPQHASAPAVGDSNSQ